MRIYVVSHERSALTVNGCFLGTVGGNLQYFEHSGNNLCISFLPNDQNLSCATAFFAKIKVGIHGDLLSVRFHGGYLLFPSFRLKPQNAAKTFYTKTFDDSDVQVRIISDPFYKILVTSGGERYFTLLKYFSPTSKIDCVKKDGLLLVQVRDVHDYLYIFTAKPLSLVYASPVKSFDFSGDSLVLTKPKKGVADLIATEIYSSADFSPVSKSVQRLKNPINVPEILRPYAFLDEMPLSSDFKDYLCGDIKKNARLIPEFFDKYLFYIPFLKNDKPYAALVYDDRAEVVSFTTTDGLISDFSFV